MILVSGVGYSSQCYGEISAGKKRVLGLVIFYCQSVVCSPCYDSV